MANTQNPTYLDGIKGSYTAGADLTDKNNLFVKRSTGTTVVMCGAGEQAAGVLLEDGVSGEEVTIGELGIFLVYSGAAVAVGAEVQSDANGKAITVAAGLRLGVAIDAATGADELIRVKAVL